MKNDIIATKSNISICTLEPKGEAMCSTLFSRLCEWAKEDKNLYQDGDELIFHVSELVEQNTTKYKAMTKEQSEEFGADTVPINFGIFFENTFPSLIDSLSSQKIDELRIMCGFDFMIEAFLDTDPIYDLGKLIDQNIGKDFNKSVFQEHRIQFIHEPITVLKRSQDHQTYKILRANNETGTYEELSTANDLTLACKLLRCINDVQLDIMVIDSDENNTIIKRIHRNEHLG
jgi:hypothetical protein